MLERRELAYRTLCFEDLLRQWVSVVDTLQTQIFSISWQGPVQLMRPHLGH